MKLKILLFIVCITVYFPSITNAAEYYLVDNLASENHESVLKYQAIELNEIYNNLLELSGVDATLIYSTDSDINAYATGLGKEKVIVIYDGLLAKLENDRDAVAAVLGHELAHHKLDHIRKGNRNKKGMTIVGAILGAAVGAKIGHKSGDLAGSIGNDVVNVGAGLVALKFSRTQEMKADKLSMAWMIEAGYNPKGMLRLQNMLGAMKTNKKKGSILSTHPTSKERYKAAEKIIVKAELSTEKLDKHMQPLVSKESQERLNASKYTPKSNDFLSDPKALCSYFASLGMKAQFQWGPAPQGDAYMCQYADEFGSSDAFVRGARVSIDPKSMNVSVGLSIQGFSLVRAEAVDILKEYSNAMYSIHNQSMPNTYLEAMTSKESITIEENGDAFSTYDSKNWDSQRVVGVSWIRQATDNQLTTLTESVSKEESIQRANVLSKLENRCLLAVEKSGTSENISEFKMTSQLLSASRYLVSLENQNNSYTCQVCDDTDPNVNCGTMGLMLSYNDKEGNQISLPAELDRKCEFYLQKSVSRLSNSFIDHGLVKRIKTHEILNDKRYVYTHELGGHSYRCVIRKKDMSFKLERAISDGQWQGVSAGVML